MLGSENHFFEQSKAILTVKRKEVFEILMIKGYSKIQAGVYLKAYDYFCVNIHAFDGATLVKDLYDLPKLDLDAMLHDFHYIEYNVGSNVLMKWKADKLYLKGNKKKGKGEYPAYSRFIGLILSGIGFVPFARIKRGKMTKLQKESFLKEYEILINN